MDIAGQNNFNIYDAEIFQCLRVSSCLFWRWSPYPVNNFIQLTVDVLFRKPYRSIVVLSSDTDWSLEWHESLHHWKDRARTFAQTAGPKPWSYCVCRQHWNLALHMANLLEHCGCEGFLLGIHLSDTDALSSRRFAVNKCSSNLLPGRRLVEKPAACNTSEVSRMYGTQF